MKSGVVGLCALVLAGVPVRAQHRARPVGPVGLVMTAGATLVRGGQSIAAKPGEILFSGDSFRTGSSHAIFLFCPLKQAATLAPGSETLLAQDSFQVKSGSIQEQHQIAACFLPPVRRLSVASMQHYGAVLARSGSATAPATTLEQRIGELPAPVREELISDLGACDAAIARDAKDLGAMVGRAASLERAGLLFDAVEAYHKILAEFPRLTWVTAKVIEVERSLETEQLKKE